MKQIYSDILRQPLCRLADNFGKWRRRHLSARVSVILIAVFTGMAAGLGAWILKSLIRVISTSFTSQLHPDSFNWVLLAGPAAGILLTAILLRRVFHRHIANGTEHLRSDLRTKHVDMPHQLMYQPVLACAITIGAGGSAGSEGPIAYAGGAIGSNMARLFRLEQPMVRLMLICGAGAGIAAIFKAPLGGFFFALEVLGASLTTLPVLVLALCCLIGAATAFILGGCTPDVSWIHASATFPWRYTLLLLPMGLLAGLYSIWYNAAGGWVKRLLSRFKRPWVMNLAAGLTLGCFVMIFPTLFGEGYGSVAKVLNGDIDSLRRYSLFQAFFDTPWLLPSMLAGIILVKGAVVTLTNNGGGVAGTFAPTLFAGCMAGALVAFGAQAVGIDFPPDQMAYLMMAGAMAGIIRAPLMATFITMEITGSYALLFPIAAVAFLSFCTVKGIEKITSSRRIGRT